MQCLPLYLFAIDPVHIGAGGYRLGRVDNTILRDAATGLPKIPGSSLNGAARAAAIYSLPEAEREQAVAYARHTLDSPTKARVHRGDDDPVACIFGYAEGDEQGTSRIGIVSFRDAEILAFPVPTMAGPRWVTTPALLAAAGCSEIPEVPDATRILVQHRGNRPERLNLGWLLLNAQSASIPIPAIIADNTELQVVQQNLVLVHEDLLPALVNANLETRTSVSIDFETGAAAEGLLFTYEAVPRGTLFRGQVDIDDQRLPDLATAARDTVQRGLTLACQLGIGGMTTRGFGRMLPLLAKEASHA